MSTPIIFFVCRLSFPKENTMFRLLKNMNEGHVLIGLIGSACTGGALLSGVNLKRQYTQYNDLQNIDKENN